MYTLYIHGIHLGYHKIYVKKEEEEEEILQTEDGAKKSTFARAHRLRNDTRAERMKWLRQ